MNDNPSPDDDRHRVTGLLTKEEIFRRLYDRSPISRLYVVPLLDKKQVGRGAIDLRLGTEFILSKRIRYTGLDPLQGEDEIGRRLQRFRRRLTDYQDRIPVRIGKSLTLHPQQFVLGSSFEYVRLPADLAAYVVGRSSWGRMGLVIATATMVHSGFAGCITLELSNIGDAPITLYPGFRIAQLALHYAGPAEADIGLSTSKYVGHTGPAETSIQDDSDWAWIERMSRLEQ